VGEVSGSFKQVQHLSLSSSFLAGDDIGILGD